MPMRRGMAHSEPEKCDLPLSDADADAAPSSVHGAQTTVQRVSDGSEAFPAQLDWLHGISEKDPARAMIKGGAPLIFVGAAANAPG